MLARSAVNKSFAAYDYLDMNGCIVHTLISFRRKLPPWLGDSKLSSSFVAAHYLAELVLQMGSAHHDRWPFEC